MIPDNACTPRITAAAGTELAGASFVGTVICSSLLTELYTPKGLTFTRCCCVRLSPIAQNSLLLPPVGVWTVLSSIVAVQPLSPATHHRLGGLLPRQLTNAPQAPPPVFQTEL